MGFTENPTIEILEAVTGHNFTKQLMEIGARIYNQERMILNREGIRRENDMIPYRISHDPIQDGPNKGRIVTPDMYNIMLDEYYHSRGWDDDGVVKENTKKALGIGGKS